MSDDHDEKPFFLFLGESDREGVVSKLKAAGVYYEKKRLESTVGNWESILSYFEDDELFTKPPLAGVLVKLTSKAINLMLSGEYEVVCKRLMDHLRHISHIIFVHESFFSMQSDVSLDSEDELLYGQFFGEVTDKERMLVNSLVVEYELNLIPFKTNAELSVLAMEFIDGSERNLILRLYVPVGRMWAGEMDKLLGLFRDYLNRVSGLSVRQEQYSTAQGTIYEFYGDASFDPSTLPQEFEDFSKLLDICAANPEAGHRMLAETGLDEEAVEEIVQRYAKEAKRLHVDLKHERERKILGIRHRLEAELTDVMGANADWAAINDVVDRHVPKLTGVSSAIGFGEGSVRAQAPPAVTYLVGTQVIGNVTGIVAQEVSGTRNIGVQAGEILELVREFGGQNTPHLVSDVYELEDKDAKSESRLTARQRLKAFLYGLRGKATDSAIELLQAYIQSKLGF